MRHMGFVAFMAAALLATTAAAQTSTPPANALWFSCDATAEKHLLATLEQASPSVEAKSADLAAAREAIRKAATLRDAALAGQGVEDPYGGAAHWARLAKASTSPRTAELFRRVAKDQFIRSHFTAAAARTSWAAGLTDNARGYAFGAVARDGCGVDEDNTAWLKADIQANGWFTLDSFGNDADQAAFLLVQHADKDPGFQREVLAMLEPLLAQKQTRPTSYAYLFDRVAVADKRPQRYGTQGRCTGPGVWEPFDVEAPDGLDQRRATVGLPTEAEYKTVFVKRCGA